MNCIETTVKYILYIFNILFLICGVLLIVLGSLMLSDMGTFKAFQQAFQSNAIPIIIIVLGGVIFIISFFGCFGAIKENICCSSTYATFMFILLCLQIALVVWIFVERTEFLKTMSDVVKTAWDDNDDSHGYPMDALQFAFNCCGLNGYQDYAALNETVPISCCGEANIDSINDNCPNFIYMSQPGCQLQFVDFWRQSLNIIRWGGIGVAVVEFIAIIFAFCIIDGIRRAGPEILEVEVRT